MAIIITNTTIVICIILFEQGSVGSSSYWLNLHFECAQLDLWSTKKKIAPKLLIYSFS